MKPSASPHNWHATGLRWYRTFDTIRVGCKRRRIFRADTCLPFLILLAKAHSGEQLLGSSFIPLTAIPNKYSIDSNWHQVGASKRLLMIAVGRPQPSWRQSGEARKVRST